MKNKIRDKIERNILNTNHCVGIEVTDYSGKITYSYTELEKIGDSLHLLNNGHQIENINSLVPKISNERVLHLVITTKSVIHKRVENTQKNNKELLSEFFPSMSINDVYFQRTSISTVSIFSIIRREVLDEILNLFADKGYLIFNISLGSFCIQSINRNLLQQKSILTPDIEYFFSEEGQISAYRKVKYDKERSQRFEIGDDFLQSENLVSYSVALQSVLGGEPGLSKRVFAKNKEEFFHEILLAKITPILLACLIVVGIINTGLYFYYKQENQEMTVKLVGVEDSLTKLEILQEKVDLQTKFASQTNLNTTSSTSFYADRLASTLVDGIKFTEILISPLIETKSYEEEENLPKFNNSSIIIKGECKGGRNYNEWINKLEKEEWVKKLHHLEYKDQSFKLGSFVLEVKI